MDSLVTYLIRCVLISALFSGYYLLALRDRRMHSFNRFYLLGSVGLSLVLPLVRIDWAPWETSNGAVRRVLVGMVPAASRSHGVFWERLGMSVCLVVSGVLLVMTIDKIRALYRLKRSAFVTSMEGYELVETEAPGTPFSFLSNLFWRSGMDREDIVNSKMLAHELAHIRGRHSWDILGIQAAVCLFWMNPFFWFIRRELNLVLEFSADAAAGAEGDPEMLARMFLRVHDGGLSPTLSSAFFTSPIKRRLIMITKNNRSRRSWMRKALVLPVVAAAVLVFACNKQQPAQQADSADVQKLKAEQLAIKLLSSDQVKALKNRIIVQGGSKQAEEQKLLMKVLQDSLTRANSLSTGANKD